MRHPVAFHRPALLNLLLHLLLLLLISLLSVVSASSPPPDQRDDDPFNILRAVEAHAVAERNAERAISAADSRARAAEKRAEAADAAASASRELALHLQVESNSRSTRVQQLEEENERLKLLMGSAELDKALLRVRAAATAAPPSDHRPFPPAICCRKRATLLAAA
jgi:hypothetical protein